MNSIALAPTSASRSLRDLKCPTNLWEGRNRPQTLHREDGLRHICLSRGQERSHHLRPCFVHPQCHHEFHVQPLQHSALHTPKLPFGTAKSSDVSPQETSKDAITTKDPKGYQQVPALFLQSVLKHPGQPLPLWAVESEVLQCEQREEQQQNLFLPRLCDGNSQD